MDTWPGVLRCQHRLKLTSFQPLVVKIRNPLTSRSASPAWVTARNPRPWITRRIGRVKYLMPVTDQQAFADRAAPYQNSHGPRTRSVLAGTSAVPQYWQSTYLDRAVFPGARLPTRSAMWLLKLQC